MGIRRRKKTVVSRMMGVIYSRRDQVFTSRVRVYFDKLVDGTPEMKLEREPAAHREEWARLFAAAGFENISKEVPT